MRPTAPRLAAQKKPGEDRDVVVGGDLLAAGGAARAWSDDRFAAGDPVRDHGQEAADQEPPEKGVQHDCRGHAQPPSMGVLVSTSSRVGYFGWSYMIASASP